jgi:hypothetical protein
MTEYDHIRPAGVCPLCGEIIQKTQSIFPVKGDITVNGIRKSVGRSKEVVVDVTWVCDAGCQIKVRGTMPVDKTRFKRARPEPKVETLKVSKETLERARRTMDALEIDDGPADVDTDTDDPRWSKPIFG